MICDSLTADPGLARGLANNQPAQDAAITSTTGRDDVSRVGRRLGDTNRTLALGQAIASVLVKPHR